MISIINTRSTLLVNRNKHHW